MISPYNSDFFAALQEGSRSSAREIVPLILEVIHPQSVIDVDAGMERGCRFFKSSEFKIIWESMAIMLMALNIVPFDPVHTGMNQSQRKFEKIGLKCDR